jgi:Flp pilus assembly protein TadG
LALALPLLVLIFTGIIEFGSAFRVEDQLQHSMMSAGRVAGQQSDSRYGDYEALRSISSTVASLSGSASIKRVIIFKAPSNGAVPASCLAVAVTGSRAGVSGTCNVYSAAQVNNPSLANFATPTACAGSAWDGNWCPLGRQPRSEQIGVFVELNYTTLTKMLPVTFTMTATSVYDLEPTPIGS